MPESHRHLRDAQPAYFLIILGPILLFLVNSMIIEGIGVPELPLDASILRADADFLEAGGRNRFLAGCLFVSAIAFACLAFLLIEWLGDLTLRTQLLTLVAFAVVQTPIWIMIVDHQRLGEEVWRSYHQLGDGVMAAVLERGSVPVCENGDRLMRFWTCGPEPGLQLFRTLLDLLNALSGIGVAALVLGMILCLARPDNQTDIAARAYQMGRAQLASRRFLYMAGLLLTSGMFVTMTWMHWPVPLVKEELRADYRQVIDGMLLYAGVFYTLLIVIGYGPVLLIQARRADRLAMDALTVDGQPMPSVSALQKWKTETGLAVSEVQSLQSLLAAGAPLIAGFAGSFSPL